MSAACGSSRWMPVTLAPTDDQPPDTGDWQELCLQGHPAEVHQEVSATGCCEGQLAMQHLQSAAHQWCCSRLQQLQGLANSSHYLVCNTLGWGSPAGGCRARHCSPLRGCPSPGGCSGALILSTFARVA